MLAAEVLFEAFRTNDFSANQLAKYEEKLKNSWIYSDLRKGRNFTPAVAMGVPFPGGLLLGFQMLTGGATPYRRPENKTRLLDNRGYETFLRQQHHPNRCRGRMTELL